MIKNTHSLSMAEASEYLEKSETKAFIKSFCEMKPSDAKELRKKLIELNLIRLNEKSISKLIDLLPIEKEELNKILPDTNLDENETNKILETIKEYR